MENSSLDRNTAYNKATNNKITDDTICRHFPVCDIKPLQYKLEKPTIFESRLNKSDFDKYNNEIAVDPGYLKLCTGVNPLTNKKIKIGGDTYNRVLKNYTIKNYKPSVIKAIIMSEYLDETDRMISDNIAYNEINGYKTKQYNELVDIVNAKYTKYNEECIFVIEKIKKLETWDSFIEFNGLKYGIPSIYENIHRENDCMGIISKEYDLCKCFECTHTGSCLEPIKCVIKCSKCQSVKFEHK
jgi:hypothetical protein